MNGEDLNPRQRRFCEFYAQEPNATAAAEKAGYSQRSAGSIGAENLKKPEILAYIRQLQNEAAEPRIAGMLEAKAVLSDIMRDPDAPPAARLKAAETLIKSAGGFVRPVARADDDGYTFYTVADNGPAIIMLPPIEKDPEQDALEDETRGEIDDMKGWDIIR